MQVPGKYQRSRVKLEAVGQANRLLAFPIAALECLEIRIQHFGHFIVGVDRECQYFFGDFFFFFIHNNLFTQCRGKCPVKLFRV